MSSLVSLKSSSLGEQAAGAIRAGIVTGEIAPGELYSVRALSEKLGVSATPVREAMLNLAGEGLVVAVRNRGFRVTVPSDDDIADILKLRLLLEVPSTGQVAESHRDEDLPRFRLLAEELPAHVTSGDVQAYLDADQEFHLGLLGLLDNARLVDIVRRLRDQSRLYDIGKLASVGQLAEAAREHGGIIGAIERRDRKLTEELMTRHLMRARELAAD